MTTAPPSPTPDAGRPYRVVDLNYFTLYVDDFQAATAFYTRVFCPPGGLNLTGI